MSDSLIEQVRKAALTQKKADVATGKVAPDLTEADAAALDSYWAEVVKLDFPALLAHLQAHQAVVDAAREYRQVERDIRVGSAGMLNAKLAMHALDAALSRIAALTGEKK